MWSYTCGAFGWKYAWDGIGATWGLYTIGCGPAKVGPICKTCAKQSSLSTERRLGSHY